MSLLLHPRPVTTYLALFTTTLLWGGTFIAGRALADSIPPVNSAFLRFVIATLGLAILTRLIEGKVFIPPRKQWLPLILLGIIGVFCHNILFFTGLQYIEAGRASLIVALNPLAITVVGVIFLGERLTLIQFAGILLSLFGAFFVISNGHPGATILGGFGIGETAILGCVASWTAYTIIGRKVLRALPPLQAVFHSSLIGTILLFPPTLINDSIGEILSYSISDWTGLIFLGLFGTAIAFSLYYQAIREIGTTRCSVFMNLVPFFSIVLSWFLLNESMNLSVLAGGLILLTGVFLTNTSSIFSK